MKKKIAFLLAMMMLLALAGCGSKINDHVVDYKIDLPDGFVETELVGADACWYNAADLSNVNLLIADKAATANAAFKAVTADILREAVESSLKEVYPTTPTITDRFFTKDDVCGLPAYQYGYSANVSGTDVYQSSCASTPTRPTPLLTPPVMTARLRLLRRAPRISS